MFHWIWETMILYSVFDFFFFLFCFLSQLSIQALTSNQEHLPRKERAVSVELIINTNQPYKSRLKSSYHDVISATDDFFRPIGSKHRSTDGKSMRDDFFNQSDPTTAIQWKEYVWWFFRLMGSKYRNTDGKTMRDDFFNQSDPTTAIQWKEYVWWFFRLMGSKYRSTDGKICEMFFFNQWDPSITIPTEKKYVCWLFQTMESKHWQKMYVNCKCRLC